MGFCVDDDVVYKLYSTKNQGYYRSLRMNKGMIVKKGGNLYTDMENAHAACAAVERERNERGYWAVKAFTLTPEEDE